MDDDSPVRLTHRPALPQRRSKRRAAAFFFGDLCKNGDYLKGEQESIGDYGKLYGV